MSPRLLAPVIILGGLRSGPFTPTDTAVVAVVYGLLVGVVVQCSLGWFEVCAVLVESARISAVLMLVISIAGTSIDLIALPLLVLIAQAFDRSFVWFGVVMVVRIAIGQITAPVAVNPMVTGRIAQAPLAATFV